jgi:alanyl-tRNA synthetase
MKWVVRGRRPRQARAFSEFLCGGRALWDYRGKDRTVRKLAGMFSCSAADVAAQVEKFAAENKVLKKRARRLEEDLAAFEAQEIIRAAEGPVIAGVLEDKTPDEARFLALNIIKSGEFAVVYGVRGESQGHLIVVRSDSLLADLRKLVPVIGSILPVKGGCGPSLVEFVTSETARLKEAVDAAVDWLRTNEEKPKNLMRSMRNILVVGSSNTNMIIRVSHIPRPGPKSRTLTRI